MDSFVYKSACSYRIIAGKYSGGTLPIGAVATMAYIYIHVQEW